MQVVDNRQRVYGVMDMQLMLDPVCTSENNFGQSNQAGQSVATSGCRQVGIPGFCIVQMMKYQEAVIFCFLRKPQPSPPPPQKKIIFTREKLNIEYFFVNKKFSQFYVAIGTSASIFFTLINNHSKECCYS